jgi:hypothetical protein
METIIANIPPIGNGLFPGFLGGFFPVGWNCGKNRRFPVLLLDLEI